jgi:thiol-disulfide isomerase/thioredoxin
LICLISLIRLIKSKPAVRNSKSRYLLCDRSGKLDPSLLFFAALAVIVLIVFVFRDSFRPGIGDLITGIQIEEGKAEFIGDDQLEGKLTLITLWGTWCPPCLMEMPHLIKLNEQTNDPNFQWFPISCEAGKHPSPRTEIRITTTDFLDKQKWEIPIYTDSRKENRKIIFASTRQQTYPTNVLIGKDRKIIHFWTGYRPGLEKEIASTISAELAKFPK